MEINVRDGRKVVEVWLTKDEKQDQIFKEYLKPLYQQYKAKNIWMRNFYPAIWIYEKKPAALLRYNKRRSAEQEVKRKRSRSMTR